jgi:hypothetical protein
MSEPSICSRIAAAILKAAKRGPLPGRGLRQIVAPWATLGTYRHCIDMMVRNGSLIAHGSSPYVHYIATGKPAPAFDGVKRRLNNDTRRQKIRELMADGITDTRTISAELGITVKRAADHKRHILKARGVSLPMHEPNVTEAEIAEGIERERRAKRLRFSPRRPKPRRDPVARYVAEWRRMRRASRANAA